MYKLEDNQSESVVGRNTINVLRMVQRRIRAELNVDSVDRTETDSSNKVQNTLFTELLHILINEKDVTDRNKILATRLHKVEDIVSFKSFVEEGIEYLGQREIEDYKGNNDGESTKKQLQLPVNTIELMKDILLDLQSSKQMQQLEHDPLKSGNFLDNMIVDEIGDEIGEDDLDKLE